LILFSKKFKTNEEKEQKNSSNQKKDPSLLAFPTGGSTKG
jgi:hypothetical protein